MRTPPPNQTTSSSRPGIGDKSSDAKPNRFSLRTMLLLVTAIACLTGWVSWKIRRARTQKFAVRKLREQGDLKLAYDWQEKRGEQQRARPQWIIDTAGEEYFQEVTAVYLALNADTAIDLTPLSSFSQLETLQVEDRFGEFSIQSRRNPGLRSPPNFAPLSELRQLKTVSLVYLNNIDLTPLGKMPWLEQITIAGNDIDISPLANLAQLKKLDLRLSSFDDLQPLQDMQSLESLALYGVSSSPMDLGVFRKLSRLKRLTIDGIQITDLRPLSQLGNLQHLELTVQPNTDLQTLSELRSLKTLRISATTLKEDDLAFLSEISTLTDLSLNGFQPNNFSALLQLEQLEDLDLTRITTPDWTALAKLPNLKRLALTTCNIKDIVPLSSSQSLERIRLHSMSKNEWDDDQIEALKNALPDCKIIW